MGLNIDIAHPTMTALLEEQKARRQQRGQMIAERLEKARIPRRLGRGAATGGRWRRHPRPFCPFSGGGRPCEKHGGSLQKYLARGKTGYVPPQWCTIKQAIDVIHHSGGKAVIAHPGRYDLSAKWLKRLLAHFSEQGGDAMEVAQCQQAPHERAQLATLAVQFGLRRRRDPIFISPARGSNLAVSSGFLPAWKASGTVGKRPPNKN